MALKNVYLGCKKDKYGGKVLKVALPGIFNGTYACFNLALAWVYRDEWYFMIASFLFPLSMIRFLIFTTWENDTDSGKSLEVLHTSGVILIFLDMVMVSIVYVTSRRKVTSGHGTTIMIAIATYTFIKLGLTISKAVKSNKDPRIQTKTTRCIAYVETAASVLSLQRSMIVSFDNGNQEWAQLMNSISGIIVCLFIATIGISMIKYGRNKNEIKNRESK